MDYRILPGLKSQEDKIVEFSMEFLSIESLKSKEHYVASCRKLIVFLSMDMLKYGKERAGKLAETNRTSADYYIKTYKEIYEESKVYQFMLLSIKNRVLGKKHITLQQFIEKCIEEFPPTNDLLFYKAKPLIMYFVRQSMASAEIKYIFKLSEKTVVVDMEINQKDLYLGIVDKVLTEITEQLTNQS